MATSYCRVTVLLPKPLSNRNSSFIVSYQITYVIYIFLGQKTLYIYIYVNSIEFRIPTDSLTFSVFTGSRSNDINREGRGFRIENKTGLVHYTHIYIRSSHKFVPTFVFTFHIKKKKKKKKNKRTFIETE